MAEAGIASTTNLSRHRNYPASLTIADLDTTTGPEPLVRDLDLADRLGLANPYDVRSMILANIAELELYGEVSRQRRETSARGGRPGTEYRLTEPQALLVCMFSRTERAAAVRKALIEVFMAWRRQAAMPAAESLVADPALPLPGRNGYGVVMIEGVPVAFDANSYALRDGAKAVVLDQCTGAVRIARVSKGESMFHTPPPRCAYAAEGEVGTRGETVRAGVVVLGRLVRRRKSSH